MDERNETVTAQGLLSLMRLQGNCSQTMLLSVYSAYPHLFLWTVGNNKDRGRDRIRLVPKEMRLENHSSRKRSFTKRKVKLSCVSELGLVATVMDCYAEVSYMIETVTKNLRFPAGAVIFLLATAPIPALEPNQPPSQWVPGLFRRG